MISAPSIVGKQFAAANNERLPVSAGLPSAAGLFRSSSFGGMHLGSFVNSMANIVVDTMSHIKKSTISRPVSSSKKKNRVYTTNAPSHLASLVRQSKSRRKSKVKPIEMADWHGGSNASFTVPPEAFVSQKPIDSVLTKVHKKSIQASSYKSQNTSFDDDRVARISTAGSNLSNETNSNSGFKKKTKKAKKSLRPPSSTSSRKRPSHASMTTLNNEILTMGVFSDTKSAKSAQIQRKSTKSPKPPNIQHAKSSHVLYPADSENTIGSYIDAESVYLSSDPIYNYSAHQAGEACKSLPPASAESIQVIKSLSQPRLPPAPKIRENSSEILEMRLEPSSVASAVIPNVTTLRTRSKSVTSTAPQAAPKPWQRQAPKPMTSASPPTSKLPATKHINTLNATLKSNVKRILSTTLFTLSFESKQKLVKSKPCVAPTPLRHEHESIS